MRAIAEAIPCCLTVPTSIWLSIYNRHVIESILTHVGPQGLAGGSRANLL